MHIIWFEQQQNHLHDLHFKAQECNITVMKIMVTQLTIVFTFMHVYVWVRVLALALALALASRVWMHHCHLERLRIWKGHLACESGLWVKDVHPAALTHTRWEQLLHLFHREGK